MYKISVLSHNLKKGETDMMTGAKKPDVLYVTFLEEIVDATVTPAKVVGDSVVSGCRFLNGVLRPPATSGRFTKVFFPQVWSASGILGNQRMVAIYNMMVGLAEELKLTIAPLEECMLYWVPVKKVGENLKNLTKKDIIFRD